MRGLMGKYGGRLGGCGLSIGCKTNFLVRSSKMFTIASDARFVCTREILRNRVKDALSLALGDVAKSIKDPMVVLGRQDSSHYQCNIAMSLAKAIKKPPQAVAASIVSHLRCEDILDHVDVSGPGFINMRLSQAYIDDTVNRMLKDSSGRRGVQQTLNPLRTVVDFSSPNIAKEMHVGHLRSTIIGDAISRILTFVGDDVVRLNHVGDWGTQFGMLIAHIKRQNLSVDTLTAQSLNDLYREAKIHFDNDTSFRDQSRSEVLALQQGETLNRNIWSKVCAASRKEFNDIYKRLDVDIQERGESFYQEYLPGLLDELTRAGFLVTSQGSKCIILFADGTCATSQENIECNNKAGKYLTAEGNLLPLMLQKSDGAYLYASNDMAALVHRIRIEKADRILAVTDVGQSQHFEMVFDAARVCGLVPEACDVRHVPFGLVLGEDGKRMRTRQGEIVKLRDLLDESETRAKNIILNRSTNSSAEAQGLISVPDASQTLTISKIVGIAAIKYADLSMHREGSYKFSFDKMLSMQGNTAPYMLYAYARIRSIQRKLLASTHASVSGELDAKCFEFDPACENKDQLGHADSRLRVWNSVAVLEQPQEKQLLIHLLRMDEVIFEIADTLHPNKLCDYLHQLAQLFSSFYESCSVVHASSPSLQQARYCLCELTADSLKLGLDLLGIKTVEKL